MEKQKKNSWKIVYVLLIVLCLACIGGMLLYLQKEQKDEAAMEKQQEVLQEQFTDQQTEADSETQEVSTH